MTKKRFLLKTPGRSSGTRSLNVALWMGRVMGVCLLSTALPLQAQQLLSLDSCRAMALRNNKQMEAAQLKQDVAKNIRKSMRTKYLPHISAVGTYQFTSEEISLLNNDQKATLANLGTGLVNDMQTGMQQIGAKLVASGIPAALVSTVGTALHNQVEPLTKQVATRLDGVGQNIVDAFHTDTRHFWAGSIMAVQPVFMGGSIVALNKMATLGERLAENSAETNRQSVIYTVDQTYWQVVSLKHKKNLAESYLAVVKKLDDDVKKMISEGVATRSDGLSVSVKVNEAEMAVQKVNDGLVLSKMLLCQMIGLPMSEKIMLADEDKDDLDALTLTPQVNVEQALDNRPELKMLDNSVAIAKQSTNLLRAGYYPQVALMGGYAVSNPSLQNGFEKKFRGFWNVGVLVRIPLWNWGDVMYKVRASKGATAIANLQREEAREKIELQVNQVAFKVEEANKRLALAEASVRKADENLHMANVGFAEGVVTPTTVMEAQTAWLQAKSQKIDAEIDVKLSQVDLQKSLGTLQ